MPTWTTVKTFIPQPKEFYQKQQGFPLKQEPVNPPKPTKVVVGDKRNIAQLVHSLALAETQKKMLQQKMVDEKQGYQKSLEQLQQERELLSKQHERILFNLESNFALKEAKDKLEKQQAELEELKTKLLVAETTKKTSQELTQSKWTQSQDYLKALDEKLVAIQVIPLI